MYENERRLITTAMQNESQKFDKALDMIIRVRLHHEKLPIGSLFECTRLDIIIHSNSSEKV